MTKPHRQKYGLGSFIKKAAKKVKKIVKSPIGKAALIGGLGWAANAGMLPGGAGTNWWSKAMGTGPGKFLFGGSKIGPAPASRGILGGAWDWAKANRGKAALLGLGTAGIMAPFFAGKDDEEEEDDWSITPTSIANIRNMARRQDPSLAFLPQPQYTQPGYYLAEGGIAGLANGGGAANAQAEQMLRMEYQKYRNQGGTMSYQQFKMAVLQQAQGQGPMAQGQQAPQMAAYGGRAGYQGGELVEDESMVEATPEGMMEENVEEVQGEPTREQMEALAMEIFQLRLEELDEEQLMVVYQAAMEQQPREEMMQEDVEFNPQMAAPQMAAGGGRIGLANGGVIGSHVPGYTTPAGYNQFDYPTGGVRVGRAEGGLMSLGGVEKDYRQEGGFVPLGKEEKADDVPARLSKNEFVFTADAVRNAGGGDIDAGAEVMQNVMTNLESGGEISEESQGAQGMYDQQQMLQSRMA
jgi:hypothetical protein